MVKLPNVNFPGGGFTPPKWQTVLIIAAALIILVAVYKAGKDKEIPTLPLPNKGTGIPSDWTQNQAIALVDEFERATSYFSLGGRETIYAKLLALTPDQLTYCYNIYQKKYAGKSSLFSASGSMYERLSSLWSGWVPDSVWSELKARMQALNLR